MASELIRYTYQKGSETVIFTARKVNGIYAIVVEYYDGHNEYRSTMFITEKNIEGEKPDYVDKTLKILKALGIKPSILDILIKIAKSEVFYSDEVD
jgi:hypothetical protein